MTVLNPPVPRRARRSNSLKNIKRLLDFKGVTFDPGDEMFRMYEVSRHLSRIGFAQGNFSPYDPAADDLQTRHNNTILPVSLRDPRLPPPYGAWRENFFRARLLTLISYADGLGVKFHSEGIGGHTEELIPGAKARLVWENHEVGEYIRVLHWLPYYIEHQPALLHKMVSHAREVEPFFNVVDQLQRLDEEKQRRYVRTVGRAQAEINRQIAAQYPDYADVSIATKGSVPQPLTTNWCFPEAA